MMGIGCIFIVNGLQINVFHCFSFVTWCNGLIIAPNGANGYFTFSVNDSCGESSDKNNNQHYSFDVI